MPGIIPPGQGIESVVGAQEEAEFANLVGAQTGIDPRVLFVQEQEEGVNTPTGTGAYTHNWLNLKTETAQSLGVRTAGSTSGGFAVFPDLQTAVHATVLEFRSPAINLTPAKVREQSPAELIAEIGASPWDAGHYTSDGQPPGSKLTSEFTNLYGASALGRPAPKGTQVNPSGSSTNQPGLGSGIVGDITAPFTSIARFFEFLLSWRFIEIVGGFLLLLVGLYLLGRQFGAPVPTPGFIAAAGNKAQRQADTSVFQSPPGAGSNAHYAQNRATTGGKRARSERVSSAPTPVYSGRARAGVGQTEEIPF